MTAASATATGRAVGADMVGRSLFDYVRASRLNAVVVGTSKDPNPKIIVLLVSPETRRTVFAVKTPTTDGAAHAVEAEARLLRELGRCELRGLERMIPRVVDFVVLDGRPAVVLTAVEGRPMACDYLGWRHTARPMRVARDFAVVGAWLARFQAATAGACAPIEMDVDVLTRLSTRFGDGYVDSEDLERVAAVHARLRADEAPRTAVHGDLWFGNVLVERRQISGVVDWEAGSVSGEPVRDLVRFPLMYALYLDRRTRRGRPVSGHRGLRADAWGAGVAYALDGDGWFPGLVRSFVRQGLERLGASPEKWRDALLAGIAEVAAHTDDDRFARRHLDLLRRLDGRTDGSSAIAAR
jgi:aminoglycoside phosphotransferase